MRYLLIFILSLLTLNIDAQQLDCSSCDVVLDGTFGQDGNDYTYSPGDTICFDAGIDRGSIRLFNWHGTEANPLTFINCNGQAVIGPTSNVGMNLQDMSHFRMTGTGDSNFDYGIKFTLPDEGATCIEIRNGIVTDYEMDHIETTGGNLGWHVVNPFNCQTPESWKENFIMRNVKIHHNYGHDHLDEAFYIGYSNNTTIECNGDVKEPFKIRNIHFYDNIAHTTGREGFQIGNADSAVFAYNNINWDYGRKNIGVQDDGFAINNNTVGDWYNNVTINNKPAEGGNGNGISVLAMSVNLYNNVTIGAEESGIFVGNRSVDTLLWGEEPAYNVYSNTVINPTNAAIDWNDNITTISELKNNILVIANAEYIQDANGSLTISNNYTNIDTANVDFVNPTEDTLQNYRLKTGSPAIDIAEDLSAIFDFDADSLDRNTATPWDAGAYEFGATAFDGSGGSDGGDDGGSGGGDNGGSDPGGSNSAPTIDDIDNRYLKVGDSISISINSSDPDGDAITLSKEAPAFIEIVDNGNGTGLLIIDPDAGDEGDYLDIDVIASDGSLSAEEKIIIQVADTATQQDNNIPENILRPR